MRRPFQVKNRAGWQAEYKFSDGTVQRLSFDVPGPDPVRLAVPKAFIVLHPGHEANAATAAAAAAIFAFLRERLAPYKPVRRIEFAELTKTISGKIRRVEVRKREAQARAAGATTPGEFVEDAR